jgi:hypothetical protein
MNDAAAGSQDDHLVTSGENGETVSLIACATAQVVGC